MEFYSVNIDDRDVNSNSKEVFFESIRVLNEFTLEDLDAYYFDDILD